jgi:membrane protein
MTESAHQEKKDSAPGTALGDAKDPEVSGMLEGLRSIQIRLASELWAYEPNASLPVRGLRATAQLIALTARGFQNDQLLLRASALTYVTALSIIPMLGVVIAILGVVGGDESIVNFAIDQLTTVAPEVRETVRGYAAGLDFSRFGTTGGAIVFGMAIFALRHLEQTLNEIWGVTRNRSWARRFSDYLAVMVVAPISIGVAVSLATTLQSEPIVTALLGNPVFAKIYGLGLAQVPVLVLFLGFTFLFWFFPNTTVQIRAAALGGAVSAVLFSMARTLYVDFQVGAATYQVVFGALSAVPLILAWLYVCWAVLLLGAEVAFATQNLPYARREMRSGETSPAQREAIALEIGVEVAQRFEGQQSPPSSERLAETLDEPVRLVRRLTDDLERAGILRAILPRGTEAVGYVPARPTRDLTVGEILRAVRGDVQRAVGLEAETISRNQAIRATLGDLERAWVEVADQTSLEKLARESGEDSLGGGA